MYLHDFDVAFCVKSNVAEWEDLSPSAVLSALRKRVAELTEDEVLEAVGFLNTIPLDDPETGDVMPDTNLARPGGNPPQPKYPAGTRILSIFGESGDTDEEIDAQTGPNAVGIISEVLPEQENCYVVEFVGGIFAFLSDEELADSHYYRVLDGASDAVAVPETAEYRHDGGEGEAP